MMRQSLFSIVAGAAAAAALLHLSAAEAQVPTWARFFNKAPFDVTIDMNGEISRTLWANSSDEHRSYFSKGLFESGERVYRLRITRTDGSFLCEMYVRLQAESKHTISECVVQSWTGSPAVKCTTFARMNGNTECEAQFTVDD